jgi:hypothetical protein
MKTWKRIILLVLRLIAGASFGLAVAFPRIAAPAVVIGVVSALTYFDVLLEDDDD